MKKSFVLLAVAVCLSVSGVRAQSGGPVGIILSSQDSVKVVRGGSELALNLADLLFPGDMIEASTEVTIMFCPLQQKLVLSAGSAAALGTGDVQVLRGSPPQRQQMSSCVLPQVAFGSENVRVMGGLRARGLPKFPVYLGGKVGKPHPTFSWSEVEGAEKFVVKLTDSQGAVLWEASTEELILDYPADQDGLEGEYVWKVEAFEEGKAVAAEQASFTVEPRGESNETEEPLLKAVLLENEGYFAEAADYYRGLMETAPEDQRILKRLSWLYWQSGLITAANEVKKRLESNP